MAAYSIDETILTEQVKQLYATTMESPITFPLGDLSKSQWVAGRILDTVRIAKNRVENPLQTMEMFYVDMIPVPQSHRMLLSAYLKGELPTGKHLLKETAEEIIRTFYLDQFPHKGHPITEITSRFLSGSLDRDQTARSLVYMIYSQPDNIKPLTDLVCSYLTGKLTTEEYSSGMDELSRRIERIIKEIEPNPAGKESGSSIHVHKKLDQSMTIQAKPKNK